jgi:hypothetical protein
MTFKCFSFFMRNAALNSKVKQTAMCARLEFELAPTCRAAGGTLQAAPHREHLSDLAHLFGLRVQSRLLSVRLRRLSGEQSLQLHDVRLLGL